MSGPLIAPEGSRNEEQRAMMERMLSEGTCPLCPGNFPNEILWQNEYWVVCHNLWPRENTDPYLLFIIKQHVVSLEELAANMDASAQLMQALAWAVKAYAIPGGIAVLRFGDFAYSAASIAHLHAHMMVPADSDLYKISIKVRGR